MEKKKITIILIYIKITINHRFLKKKKKKKVYFATKTQL